MKRTRVVLADDMAVVRQGVRAMLSTVDDVEIVGEAADGEEAVRLARELQPDAVLIDQDIPLGDGVEVTRTLKQEIPHVEVIVMTDRLDAQKALEAAEAGATGIYPQGYSRAQPRRGAAIRLQRARIRSSGDHPKAAG